jgi:plastocyanin
VRIETHSFYFHPNRIVVKAGRPVELEIHNSATFVPHNFSVHDAEAGLDVHADVRWFHGSARARFTPKKAGEYTFLCAKDAHMKKGMTGTLVVKP